MSEQKLSERLQEAKQLREKYELYGLAVPGNPIVLPKSVQPTAAIVMVLRLYGELKSAHAQHGLAALETKLEAVRQVMYHSNDDTAGRLATALGIISPAVQQEKENEQTDTTR